MPQGDAGQTRAAYEAARSHACIDTWRIQWPESAPMHSSPRGAGRVSVFPILYAVGCYIRWPLSLHGERDDGLKERGRLMDFQG